MIFKQDLRRAGVSGLGDKEGYKTTKREKLKTINNQYKGPGSRNKDKGRKIEERACKRMNDHIVPPM